MKRLLKIVFLFLHFKLTLLKYWQTPNAAALQCSLKERISQKSVSSHRSHALARPERFDITIQLVSGAQVSIKWRSRKIGTLLVVGWKGLSHKSFNSAVWVGPTDIRYVYSDVETSRLNRRMGGEKRLDLTLICYKQTSYIILLERAFAPRSPDLHKNGVPVQKCAPLSCVVSFMELFFLVKNEDFLNGEKSKRNEM